jgi:hypothetical protein
VTTDPYAPPAARVGDIHDAEAAPALWNPNACANWCLIFTPAFGAFLHMLNWDALREPDRAASAKRWFVTSLIILGAYIVLPMLVSESKAASGIIRSIALVYLFVWYFASARGQISYVADRFGKEYPRKSWGKPLVIGLLAWVGYMLVTGVVVYALIPRAPS